MTRCQREALKKIERNPVQPFGGGINGMVLMALRRRGWVTVGKNFSEHTITDAGRAALNEEPTR